MRLGEGAALPHPRISEWGDRAQSRRAGLRAWPRAPRRSRLRRAGARLCGHFRVACPDLAGRGDSDRLPDASLYAVPQYLSDM